MNYIMMLISSMSVVPFLVFVGLVFLYLKQKKSEAGTIPPLDLVDAKKLDSTVASKVQSALLPLLQEEGYSKQDVDKILVRTSLLGKPGSR
jgi:hypothetical protein